MDKGGLAVGSLLALNQALVYKWRWRFVTGSNRLWVKVIKSCYGVDGGFLGGLANSVTGRTGVWRGVLKLVDRLHTAGTLSRDSVRRQVNNGASTRFWSDVWCGPISFQHRFSRLFHLTTNQEGMVSEFRNGQSWQFQWNREVRGGASAAQLDQLQHLLEDVVLRDTPDGWAWGLNDSSEFSVADVRNHLDDMRLPAGNAPTLWSRFLPIKINIFVWRVALNRLPTRCNLVSKGIDLETVLCPVCQMEVESLAHILFQCEVAFALWGRVATWCDAYMPVFDSFGEVHQWIDGQSTVNFRRSKMEAVCFTLMWVLWMFRNGMVLVIRNQNKIYCLIQLSLIHIIGFVIGIKKLIEIGMRG
ncbi:hypothetical protein LXL04_027299 [Taraxacum kok-saghyz]